MGDTTGAVETGAYRHAAASPHDTQDLSRLPIGMFDSGIGGLTVLHECLVAMPSEDFVYFGDTARFPYGAKSQRSWSSSPIRSPPSSRRCRVKLLVVACYSATSAALPAAAGALRDADRRRRHAGRARGRAELALPPHRRARHRGDRGQRQLRARRPQPRRGRRGVSSRPAPGWSRFIQDGDVASQELTEAVRGFTAPLKEKRPDVVIMGCTHYPLIAPMLQRHLGRDVTLVNPAAEVAREVEAILARQGIAQADVDRRGRVPLLLHRRRRGLSHGRRPLPADAARRACASWRSPIWPRSSGHDQRGGRRARRSTPRSTPPSR